jgi:hypothetical protein
MGEIYRAYDQHLERDVVLKILPAGLLSNEAQAFPSRSFGSIEAYSS